MNVDIKDLGKGWFEIGIGITSSEIKAMIAGLEGLQQRHDHFHVRSDFSGDGGVGDIEIYWIEEDAPKNMTLDTSPPIDPTR
jgi:hypothetical protein